MPPTFPQERPPQQSQQEALPPQPQPAAEPQGMPEAVPEPTRASSKSRSIFTPVEESRSLLAQHWGMGTTLTEQQTKAEEGAKLRSVDAGGATQTQGSTSEAANAVPSRPTRPAKAPQRELEGSDAQSQGAQLAAAQGGKRPRLKVQIPDEPSDGGSATGESSPRNSDGTTGGGPSAKGGTEGSHSSGVVLPPPSPSASAILSAGAQGPPNPFARPNPPSSAAPNTNIDTPISALPSRFMADGLLPSPSSFYPEWGFGRNSGDSNMLPSPLNFQTPVAGNGPSFLREDPESMKRKTPEGEGSDGGNAKRMKT